MRGAAQAMSIELRASASASRRSPLAARLDVRNDDLSAPAWIDFLSAEIVGYCCRPEERPLFKRAMTTTQRPCAGGGDRAIKCALLHRIVASRRHGRPSSPSRSDAQLSRSLRGTRANAAAEALKAVRSVAVRAPRVGAYDGTAGARLV